MCSGWQRRKGHFLPAKLTFDQQKWSRFCTTSPCQTQARRTSLLSCASAKARFRTPRPASASDEAQAINYELVAMPWLTEMKEPRGLQPEVANTGA